jgi:hypothetical protein
MQSLPRFYIQAGVHSPVITSLFFCGVLAIDRALMAIDIFDEFPIQTLSFPSGICKGICFPATKIFLIHLLDYLV